GGADEGMAQAADDGRGPAPQHQRQEGKREEQEQQGRPEERQPSRHGGKNPLARRIDWPSAERTRSTNSRARAEGRAFVAIGYSATTFISRGMGIISIPGATSVR